MFHSLRTEDWFQFGTEDSLRKRPTFHDTTTGFPLKWRLRNECRNSILMTCHHPELGSASDSSYRLGIGKFASTNQKHYPDLGSDASSVCLCWHREVSAVFSGYTEAGRLRPLSALTSLHENSAFVFLQRPAVLQILDEWNSCILYPDSLKMPKLIYIPHHLMCMRWFRNP